MIEMDHDAMLMALSSMVNGPGWKLLEQEIHKAGASDNSKLLCPRSEGGRTASENALYLAGRVSALSWLAKLPYSLQEMEDEKSTPDDVVEDTL